jgi:hypothetical protein
LRFNGIEIHKAQLTGILKISITLKGIHPEGFPIFERFFYKTVEQYNYEKFESYSDKDQPDKIDDEIRPYAKLDGEGISTKTNIMEIYTPRTRPEITFWFADVENTEARFKLVFQRLIGYKDKNENGMYDVGEESFQVFLEDVPWVIDDLIYSVDPKYGNYVEFRLFSEVGIGKFDRDFNLDNRTKEFASSNDESTATRQITYESDDQKNEYERLAYLETWAEIEFKFLVTSNSFEEKYPYTYEINGDTELKIDININIHKPIYIDGICIEQVMYDEGKTYGFLTKEADGNNIYLPESEDSPVNMRNFVVKNINSKQWVMFIDDSGKEYGFYSWVSKINVTNYDGTSEIIDIASSYTTDGSVFNLFTSYPYTRDIRVIEHDPSVGMIKESKPEQKSEPENGLIEMLFNPVVYIVASIVAILILLFIYKSQSRDIVSNQRPRDVHVHRKQKEPEDNRDPSEKTKHKKKRTKTRHKKYGR